MKKILFILALAVAGGLNAQDLSIEMTRAMKNNDVSALSPLVTEANKDACIQVGSRQATILQLALQMGGADMITHLIEEKNVDINKACAAYTPLMWAAKNSTPEMVSLLLEAGADKSIEIGDRNALFYAEYHNRTEIIALLSN
jgi:ankyrin repeat protein